MGWSVWLDIDTGGANPAVIGDSSSCTFNVAPMFYKAFGGDGFRGLDGMSAALADAGLSAAIAEMEATPQPYRDMNPANGWGSYDSALNFLHEVRNNCRRHPKATLRIS